MAEIPPSATNSNILENQRGRDRIPGGFQVEEQQSPVKTSFVHGREGPIDDYDDPALLPPLPREDDSLILAQPDEDSISRLEGDATEHLNEREMRRRLMDIESSFLPAHSPEPHVDHFENATAISQKGLSMGPPPHPSTYKSVDPFRDPQTRREIPQEDNDPQSSPPTPPDAYRTPAPHAPGTTIPQASDAAEVLEEGDSGLRNNTLSLETMSSSPTAAAAARTVSRAVSMASLGYETANDSPVRSENEDVSDTEVTPRKHASTIPRSADIHVTPKPRPRSAQQQSSEVDGSELGPSGSVTTQPRFLRNRYASQRSSTSSFKTSTDSHDGASDVTISAKDPSRSGASHSADTMHGSSRDLSRTISLGSMASGITGMEDSEASWDRGRNISGLSLLSTSAFQAGGGVELTKTTEEDISQPDRESNPVVNPITPKASSRNVTAPTDTVIAQHVRNIHVPDSVAREYRQNHRPASPEKMASMATPLTGRGKGLTLKEQSSTIDRLQKENFDLKLKIHYLNQALNERSEEGVKEMISENVELKAGLATMEKQARSLRKTIRDLERKLKEHEESDTINDTAKNTATGPRSPVTLDPEVAQEMEEEITYLRERIETYEVEIEHMRNEAVTREGDKRRLAELVGSMGDRKGAASDVGTREETDMWKDLLEAETARREQADEDNRRLREEIWRLKDEGTVSTDQRTKNAYSVSKRHQVPQSRSRSPSPRQRDEQRGDVDSVSSTVVEQLRHENEELRREVGAQTSMLTSRNREKERLYQEIEDLKLGQLRGEGGRSVAGDSILDRSASRAYDRSTSRTSVVTRATNLSDSERDEYENRNGQLRDQISALKLTNQELERQLESCLDDLERSDAAKAESDRTIKGYDDELQLAMQDLQTMQTERDETLAQREQLSTDFDSLQSEAQAELDALESELEQKAESINRLEAELTNREENFNALQAEMRSMSEGVVRLEDDQQANARRAQGLQQDLDFANRELEGLEKNLRDANAKIERFTVQQESSQGEIAFLREEQDGDKIKIGDLEAALKKAHLDVQDARENIRELESRLADERKQREAVANREKHEVQQIMNDLNREASGAKDEARKLRKFVTAKETEAAQWKERLAELENNLRHALGDLNGTRSSILSSVTKMQKELEDTLTELDTTKNKLSEKEHALKYRDTMLENIGLESRRLQDMLEKEKEERGLEKYQYEQIHKTSLQSSRAIAQKEARILELEGAVHGDKRKQSSLESHFKEQLRERNNLLLALWNRLSTLCGKDWAHRNALVDGRVPSIEVIATALPVFSKNLLGAVKTMEGVVGAFRTRVRAVEKDLSKQYQSLEHQFDVRNKKLAQIESLFKAGKLTAPANPSSEMVKMRAENSQLKTELYMFQRPDRDRHSSYRGSLHEARIPSGNVRVQDVRRGSISTMARHNSASAVEAQERRSSVAGSEVDADERDGGATTPQDQRWILRLRELERRLKAEREARLLDRHGARKRLEEGRAENEELRMELEREKVRKGGDPGPSR
ncbi:MAG: Anucleate primary sterigmata protein B [Caeruleum heppii]|nr:MAG: Anucleate primary sterigmata protein B [Caeruleum heppii]